MARTDIVTPGPWKAVRFAVDGKGLDFYGVANEAGRTVAYGVPRRASAQLLSAAPDLYDALEAAVNCIAQLVGGPGLAERINADPERFAGFLAAMQQGEAALAKAKGQEPAGEVQP